RDRRQLRDRGMGEGSYRRQREDAVLDKGVAERRAIPPMVANLIGLDHGTRHLTEVGRGDWRGGNAIHEQLPYGATYRKQVSVIGRAEDLEHPCEGIEKRSGEDPGEGMHLGRELGGRRLRRQLCGWPIEKAIGRIAQTVRLDRGRRELANRPTQLLGEARQ